MQWRPWCKLQLQLKPGRAILLVVGVSVLVGAFLQNHERNEFAIAAVLAGALLVIAGGLRLATARAGPGGIAIEVAEEEAAAEVAEEVTHEAATAGQEVTVDEDETRDAIRFYVADKTLRALLTPSEGPLAGTEFHLYVYDSDLKRLTPVFEPDDGEPSEGWAAGQGVTGEAYTTSKYVFATAPETRDGTYGLTKEQQKRYRELEVVAALPVINAAGSMIAVLSGASTDPESQLVSDEGYEEHLTLGISVARVLIDLLHWFSDDEE